MEGPRVCKSFEIPNCISGSSLRNCEVCEAGYVIQGIYDGNCIKPYDFVVKNCLKHEAQNQNSKILGDLKCQACIENHFPLDLLGQFVCIEESYLALWGILQVKNCLKYGKNNLCSLCADGFFLEQTNNNV